MNKFSTELNVQLVQSSVNGLYVHMETNPGEGDS